MSLFQCEHCGCQENTALASTYSWIEPEAYDWTGMEDRRGKKLCSACLPARFSDGTDSGHGKWHGRFEQVFLEKGKYRTDRVGNLERIPDTEEKSEKKTTVPTRTWRPSQQ